MNCYLFLESQAKSSVEETPTTVGESKKALKTEPSKVTADTPAKVASNAIEGMDVDAQATDSTENKSGDIQSKVASTKNTDVQAVTTDTSKVGPQTTEGKNDTIPKNTPAKPVSNAGAKTVNTPVKANSVTTHVGSPATKVTAVSSKQSLQSVVTPVQNTTASGNAKIVNTSIDTKPQVVQTSSTQVKNTPIQTVTIVSNAKTKSASPVVKSVSSAKVVQNQVKIPGVLSPSVVAYNGVATVSASSVTSVMNKSMTLKTSEAKKELPLFKLGMEKSYEQYVNQFSTNQLAKNKQHAQEERDRRRGISTKFNLAEYNYTGSIIGNLERILLTLRCSIVTLETSIPTAFMHPMWPVQRSTWVKAVHMSKTAPEFASVLSFFEGFVKPVVMRNVWSDAVGHLEFFRNLTESKTAPSKKTVKEEEEEIKNIESIGKLVFYLDETGRRFCGCCEF